MGEAAVDGRRLMAAGPGVRLFTCSFCAARPLSECVTRAGTQSNHPHRARQQTATNFLRSSCWVVRMIAADPRMGLDAGDELLVQKYRYDSKVTVLRRISDGYDPECNQYSGAVEFVRFAEAGDLAA
jgi:hypothetical protein